MKKAFFYQTGIGEIVIGENGTAITHLYFGRGATPQGAVIQQTPLLEEAARQLHDYLAGKRQLFELPLEPEGTEFQRNVWLALQEVPYGETRSYRQIAERIARPKACRAVGMANNRNPISIFIPCHRVIGANGKLVGYGGGLHIKEHLLNLERKSGFC